MNDTTTSKPVWTRCIGCKQRIFNAPIDISAHKPLCPALLERRIKNLGTALEKLTDRIGDLEHAEPPAPAVDLDDVADWPADALDGPADFDDLDDDPPAGNTDAGHDPDEPYFTTVRPIA